MRYFILFYLVFTVYMGAYLYKGLERIEARTLEAAMEVR